MRSDQAQPIRLSDYRPPDYLIETVELDILLHPTATRVRATLKLRPNPQGQAGAPLHLDGDELVAMAVQLDGVDLDLAAGLATAERLTIETPPQRPFTLTTETMLDPSANTKLMGLYRSGSAYCTQCEAEGFRRITYYLDRPDVLAVFTTRIEASREEAPVLLGNGNPVSSGGVPGTDRHYAVWHDPHPKPAYLFAVVGGALDVIKDRITTSEARDVDLAIYVEPGKTDFAAYAMDALKRSMRWDEEVFGRAYDLDVFNIVAVSDFNMGAMENKGLNVFNDKYVLASPATATDADYAGIETVIAHEYFHNWTGNRITCRDWFQLSLKEGLTVFRDQEFSADQRSRAVKRIADVRSLRSRQFAEDGGPLAHSVRPESYREINNFYTATIYEKGAEIIRMYRTLVGADAFDRGMALYFERFDGTAATVEDFLGCFAESSGRDLTQFFRWYVQAGTPRIEAAWQHDAATRRLTLDLAQTAAATPGQPEKLPFVVPVAFGLVSRRGTPGRGDGRARRALGGGRPQRHHRTVDRGPPDRLRGRRGRDDPVLVARLLCTGETLDGRERRRPRHPHDLRQRSLQPMGGRADRPDPSHDWLWVKGAGGVARLPESGPFGRHRGRRPGSRLRGAGAELPGRGRPGPRHRPGRRPGCHPRRTGEAPWRHGTNARARPSRGPRGPTATGNPMRPTPAVPDDAPCATPPCRSWRPATLGSARPWPRPQFETADNMTDRLAALAVLTLIPGAAREAALDALLRHVQGRGAGDR